MKITLAFDVYGTLIDTQGVLSLLGDFIDTKAQLFSDTWRAKQLEYSFRKGLMKRYDHFSVCTKEALNYTCASLNIELSDAQKQALLESYQHLPAFKDANTSLSELAKNYRLIAFSNGESKSVNALLKNANISSHFSDVVCADEIHTFKPNPEIYQHLLSRVNSTANQTWLISSNPFDVIGAKSYGLKAVWVKRSASAVFDPWGIEPDATINSLSKLSDQLHSTN